METLYSRPFDFTPLDGSLRPMGEGRPAGLHLSQIIKEMKVQAGESVTDLPGYQPGISAQAGFLLEIALEYAFKEFMGVQRQIERQLRLEADGVHGTPDGFDRELWQLEEDKSTDRSMRAWEEDPFSFWTWMVQTKGYLKMLSEQEQKPVTDVRFFVLFWHGDYSRKPGRGRQIRDTLLRFTTDEIEENWRTVLRYRDWMERPEKEQA